MDGSKHQLVFDLVLGRVSVESFVELFGVDPRSTPDAVRRELEQALAERCSESVECAVILAHRFGLSRSWAQVFCDLLDKDWHFSHEAIADALQDIRVPSTADHLYRAACTDHDYLIESPALAIKCVWALHDIATPEAIVYLRLLASSASEAIRTRASRRLSDLAERRRGDPEPPYRLQRDKNVRAD